MEYSFNDKSDGRLVIVGMVFRWVSITRAWIIKCSSVCIGLPF
jgi:hypothetical protein